jgi:hypothetical protein
MSFLYFSLFIQTAADCTFTEKDFADLLDGLGKLLTEGDDPPPSTDPKKSKSPDKVISKKKPGKKEELCSIQ